jgi:tetratricopeptide (TPR) repeat protein
LTYHSKGNYEKSLKKFNEALTITEKLGDLQGKAINLYNIGKIYEIKGDCENAKRKYEQSLEICIELNLLYEINMIKDRLNLLKK